MTDLLFATNNLHKVSEIKKILPTRFSLLTPHDKGFYGEIPEDHDTIEENAIQKVRFIHDLFGINCFADDTGLETEALNNEPGVHSARYAGEDKNFESNIDKLLDKLTGINNRKARFKTVISLIINNELHLFEGIVTGIITHERRGKGGFGYDSVFIPDGYKKTFAELTLEEKNQISHRGIAVGKLVEFLNNY